MSSSSWDNGWSVLLRSGELIEWMWFNVVFNNCSVISRRPVHLLICFLAFSHQSFIQYTFQATGCFSTYIVSPLAKDERRLPQSFLSNVWKHFGRAGIRTHNPLMDNQRRYRQSYRRWGPGFDNWSGHAKESKMIEMTNTIQTNKQTSHISILRSILPCHVIVVTKQG